MQFLTKDSTPGNFEISDEMKSLIGNVLTKVQIKGWLSVAWISLQLVLKLMPASIFFMNMAYFRINLFTNNHKRGYFETKPKKHFVAHRRKISIGSKRIEGMLYFGNGAWYPINYKWRRTRWKYYREGRFQISRFLELLKSFSSWKFQPTASLEPSKVKSAKWYHRYFS